MPFIRSYNYFRNRKILLTVLAACVISLSLVFITRLSFEEDITRVMPEDEQLDQVSKVFGEFDFIDKLVITVSLEDTKAEPDPGRLISFSEILVDSLKKNLYPELVSAVLASGAENQVALLYDLILEYLPVFLDRNDYFILDSLIQESSIKDALSRNYKTLISPAGSVFKRFIVHDPLNFTGIALKKMEDFQLSGNFILYNNYFFSRDLKHLFLFVTPAHPSSESKKNGFMLKKIDEYIAILSQAESDVVAEYYGGVAVAVGNANRIKKDITVTITIAVILLLLVIGSFYRQIGIFFIIFLPALFGAAVALALIFFINYRVSAISLAIGSVLLGITIDYALHLFTHFKRIRSVKKVLEDVALPVMMSGLTTASAFLCLLLIGSDVLRDLGLFAAISVIVAAFFSLIVLPHFSGILVKSTRNYPAGILERFTAYRFDRNKFILGTVLALSVLFLFFFRKVGFDGDMYNMNYMSPELAEAESNLDSLTNLTLNSTYLVSRGKDFDEALATGEKILPELERMKGKGIVNNFVSLNSFFVSESLQKERIARWHQYWSQEKTASLMNDLVLAGTTLKFNEKAFAGVTRLIAKDYIPLTGEYLLDQDISLINDWISESETEVLIASQVKLDRTRRKILYDRFSDQKIIIFDKSFITDKIIEVLQSNFRFLVFVSLTIVFSILLIFFGRIELAIISFIPILLSWLWTLGIMGLLSIKFTIFNIIISTFVFGLGIDYTIFIMRGLQQEYKFGYQNFSSYKTSVFLSACTTIIGIGALIFARHPALRSIAAVSIAGVGSVVIISYTILPVLFQWLTNREKDKESEPFTFL
ncbi:MAG: MMPL family transporter, partial [Bacteroidales bacterium]